MKRKIFYSILIAVLLLTVTACGSDEEPDKGVDDKFFLQYENLNIKLGSVFTTEKYGDEIEYIETPSCAFEGLDKTYRYEHYEINTYPDQEKDKIISIYFLDDQVSTTEGVRLGDSKDQMIETYGNEYKKQDALYTYTRNDTQLQLIIQDDTIVSIEYIYNVK